MDAEKVGRALIEYCGFPLAVFMTFGLVGTVLPQYGVPAGFLNPLAHVGPFYVVNFWLVMGVYVYRQKYRPDIVFDTRKELFLAFFIGLTWAFSQPLLLLVGYGLFMKAVWHNDRVAPFFHSKLFPDIPAAGGAQGDTSTSSGERDEFEYDFTSR